jgi:hypothetical protein
LHADSASAAFASAKAATAVAPAAVQLLQRCVSEVTQPVTAAMLLVIILHSGIESAAAENSSRS